MNCGALSILSIRDSQEFRRQYPECVLPSNMLDKYKLQDDGSVKEKSRIVLLGWKDPMIHQLERAAPTPTQEGIMVTIQWMASKRVQARVSDLKNAFGQSQKTTRTRKLATELPRGVVFPGIGPGQLLLLETEVYGLIS